MAKRSGFQTCEQLDAERAAARIANLAIYSDADLVVRLMDAERETSHWMASDGAHSRVTMFRNELQRRRAAQLVAA